MIPKTSQKAPKWRQNPCKIDDFCKMHSWSYFFHLLSGFNTKMTIFRLLWEPRGAVNEPSFSSLFLSWGPLGAKVAQKPSPRASGNQFEMIFVRFPTNLGMFFDDLWEEALGWCLWWFFVACFFYSSLHLCLVAGDHRRPTKGTQGNPKGIQGGPGRWPG